MIMRPGQQLLLPANPFFIWGSLIAAMLLNMLQNMGFWGRAGWVPDLLAVVLVFWTVHQPMRISIGGAFVFGLLMDVHQGGLLGQNALAYTVLSFLPSPCTAGCCGFRCPRRRPRSFRCLLPPMRLSWHCAWSRVVVSPAG